MSIATDAAVGTRTVTVTNPDAGRATKVAFTVNAVPTATAITPNVVRQGQAVRLQIAGSGFLANFVAGGGSVQFGPDVVVNSVSRPAADRLTVNITVAGNATPGAVTSP